MKAAHVRDVTKFQDIPNVGPAMERDLRLLGYKEPSDVKGEDPYQMYQRLEKLTGIRQDPCVLDTFLAIQGFLSGDPARPWFWYTNGRKEKC